MAQDKKLKQVIIVGVQAVGYIMNDYGVVNDPNFAVEAPLNITIGVEDFADKEEFHTISQILTRIARIKVTKGLEEKNVSTP